LEGADAINKGNDLNREALSFIIIMRMPVILISNGILAMGIDAPRSKQCQRHSEVLQ
jgi:hypothetical protein